MPQHIFITGVSSGLGYGLAKVYLEQHNMVFGVSRTPAKNLPNLDKFQFKSLDLALFDQIKTTLLSLLKDTKKLDLVILNAGILGELHDIQKTPLSNLKKMMDVNLWSNKVILDTLFEQDIEVKQVIAMSSGASVNGHRGWSGYSISKAALNMLVTLYAAEKKETHFTAFAPGLVDTKMQDYLCEEVSEKDFPSVSFLKEKRYTNEMPGPLEAAETFYHSFPNLLNYETGSYLDSLTM